jgi:hypothetical protein
MRKEFRRLLKKEFTERLQNLDSGFTLSKGESPYVFPRDVVFSRVIQPPGISLFVILLIDDRRESFALEIGWSTMGRFPELSPRPAGRPTPNRSEFARPEFICRLGDVSSDATKEWLILPDLNSQSDFLSFVKETTESISPEKAIHLVKPQVQAAIEQLGRHGLPYLHEYLKSLYA